MRKAGLVFIALLVAGLRLAIGQLLPKPLPQDHPEAINKALTDKLYPSAWSCGQCHPKQFSEWSISSHAYATLSPMFDKLEQKINDLSQGTIQYFCLRCHAGVGTALGETRDIPWSQRSGAAKEGVTCVTCHRVGEAYGKVNASQRIAPGDIHGPAFGPFDVEGVLMAISNARRYQILVSPTEPDKPGWLRIHQQSIRSHLIVRSEFCASCHQVQVYPGIKLETVWEEYQASPAAQEGITCQDCHMSTSPGRPSGYQSGPAAIVNGKVVNANRKLTDHSFLGPGYPISHPGLFPLGPDESPFTPERWLKFDYRAGWGSEGFEAEVAKDPGSHRFPPEWEKPADRKVAWLTVQANLDRWKERLEIRRTLLANSARLDGPFFDSRPKVGRPCSFSYKVTNLNKGHNLPSGSPGAQPELWLNVALIDPDGHIVWESGSLDKNGDLGDFQSDEVLAGRMPYDDQLFSLQNRFLTTNLKGTDRETYLPLNVDVDQLPFVRPGSAPTSLLNHPPGVRLEKHSIPPLCSRVAHYKVPGDRLQKAGTYRLAVRMRSRSEPISFMNLVGATTDMKRNENEWITDSHAYAVEFAVRASAQHSLAAADLPHVTAEKMGPETSPEARILGDPDYPDPPGAGSFGPSPSYSEPYGANFQLAIYGNQQETLPPYDAAAQLAIDYGRMADKHQNATAHPLILLGPPLYGRGPYEPAPTWLGVKNPIDFHFMAYGDLRVAAADNDNGRATGNAKANQSSAAGRLNLDVDIGFTGTERIHALMRPMDQNGSFTRYDIDGEVSHKFVQEFNSKLITLFFEGDLGNMLAGWTGKSSAFTVPVTFGLVPIVTQNGIWIQDAFNGGAIGITGKHSRALDVTNMDLTFFAGFDRVTTAAAPGNGKTRILGLAGFADAPRGYLEFGYGYTDAGVSGLSYHNVTGAFTQRLGDWVSNSVRLIGNFGQRAPVKTADGLLVLVESSLITSKPLTLVPYLNLFAGVNTPQSLARAADAGGVLVNTGINFQSDGLTSYPTLDATARKSYGGALGVEYLFNLDRQLVVEGAGVGRIGSSALGSQYALGLSFQQPLTNAWILRLDAIRGWLQGQRDIFGARLEFRRKF